MRCGVEKMGSRKVKDEVTLRTFIFVIAALHGEAYDDEPDDEPAPAKQRNEESR